MNMYVVCVQLFRTGGMGCPPSSEKYRIYWLFGVTCSATMISGTVLYSCSCPLFATLLRNLIHSSFHPWPSHLVFTVLESRPLPSAIPQPDQLYPFPGFPRHAINQITLSSLLDLCTYQTALACILETYRTWRMHASLRGKSPAELSCIRHHVPACQAAVSE